METEEGKLDNLIKQLQTSPNDYNKIHDFLQLCRNAKFRLPDLVVLHAPKIVAKISGDEKWMVYEQLLMAHLDLGQIDEANSILAILKKKFRSNSQSSRLAQLQGMIYEANGEYQEAIILYQKYNKIDNPSSLFSLKRLTAIYKSQGNNEFAIRTLCEYLEISPSEESAWLELSHLYISLRNYTKAAFCYEELILISPHNYHHHTKYAEILYTIGGSENLLLARKYFAHSLTLSKKENMRSLFGLYSVCTAIASTSEGNQKNQKLLQFALNEIENQYKSTPHSFSQTADLLQN